MDGAVDLATKVIGALAALLGLAGYVLILGAAILWLRLQEVDLPPQVAVSIASREELITIGAQAVAIWLVLVGALGGLGAWIVTGDPDRRHLGYAEVGLALAITLSTLVPLETDRYWLLFLPAIAVTVTAAGALLVWPSLETVATVLLPIAVGVLMALLLSTLGNDNHLATATGATCIFGALLIATPPLQRWRVRQDANQLGLARLEAEKQVAGPERKGVDQVTAALERGAERSRPPVVLWVGRIAVGLAVLVVVGVVAVASQIDRDKDFHKALVSLTNGDCLVGSFVTRSNEQIVIAQPGDDDEDERGRISTIPTKEVLEMQVYGKPEFGPDLERIEECTGPSAEDALVHPAKSDSSGTVE